MPPNINHSQCQGKSQVMAAFERLGDAESRKLYDVSLAAKRLKD